MGPLKPATEMSGTAPGVLWRIIHISWFIPWLAVALLQTDGRLISPEGWSLTDAENDNDQLEHKIPLAEKS